MPPTVDICTTTGICPPGIAAGQPMPVNMAYFGGNVQTRPKIYLVLWGWGEPGAFDHTSATNSASDPDGVGALMRRFVASIGGTSWGKVSAQYYQSNYNGTYSNVGNPAHELVGVWYDNTNPIHDNLSPLELAQEAARGALQFGIGDLANAQVVVATPQKFNEAGFNQNSYCAWHDFTTPLSYPGVTAGMAFVNCLTCSTLAADATGFRQSCADGRSDGVTIVLGHEIAETFTDPVPVVGRAGPVRPGTTTRVGKSATSARGWG